MKSRFSIILLIPLLALVTVLPDLLASSSPENTRFLGPTADSRRRSALDEGTGDAFWPLAAYNVAGPGKFYGPATEEAAENLASPLTEPASPRTGDVLLAYKDSVKNGYNFLLYVPERYYQDEEADLPVLVCLHGKSLRGNNLNQVTRYGCIDALRRGRPIDALVICPQCPSDANWDADRVMAVVDWVAERYRTDQDRLYVFGMSMGGWGTFKVVAQYPDRVAAAIPMCGGFTGDPTPMGDVPLWIIHGVADDITRISFSTSIVEQLEKSGHYDRLRFTWLEGCNHSILIRVFLLEAPYKWLFSHTLKDPDRLVNFDYDVTPADLNAAYTRLDPEKAQQLPVLKP